MEKEPGATEAIHLPDGLGPPKGRRVLDANELSSLVNARPRFECEMRLPGDSRKANRVFMFSIDGTLRGKHLAGCLFAGEAILVQAENFEGALKIARDGLTDTVRLLHIEYAQRPLVESANDGIVTDVAGRRVNGSVPGQLASDPKMKAFLSHLIGELPWKW